MTLGLCLHARRRDGRRAAGRAAAASRWRTSTRLLDHLSGLLLTGGPDLDPSCYGAEPHPELGPTDPVVDAFEVELCRRAYRRGMPILGICRGAQVLNVARQGHPASARARPHRGRGRAPPDRARASDDPRGARGARLGLAQTTGGGPVKVNSFHHQAIDRLGARSAPGRMGRGRRDRGRSRARAGSSEALRPGRAVARRDARRRSRAAGAVRAPGRGRRGSPSAAGLIERQDSDSGEQEDSGAHAV